VFPRLLGTLQQQVDDVGLNTLNQDEHGTGVVGVPLLVDIERTLIGLEGLIGSIE